MGDQTAHPGAPAGIPRQDADDPALPTSSDAEPDRVVTEHSPAPAAPQLMTCSEQTTGSRDAFASQLDMAYQQQRNAPFDMSAMANTLPQSPYRAQPYSHFPQMLAAPFGTPTTMSPMATTQYYVPQHTNMGQFYTTPLPSQPSLGPPTGPELGYYQSPVPIAQQVHPGPQYYYPPTAQFPGHPHYAQGQVVPGSYSSPLYQQQPDPRYQQPQPGSHELNPSSPVPHGEGLARGRQSVVRGPPRKPRQSGHAIWIGNLPPQTNLMSLVHHVCKETEGLESLFLISKSNCAFANFGDEQSCSAAQRKLHDSKFLTVRLVSRLRKSTVEGPAGATAPTGPAASAPHAQEAGIARSDSHEAKENKDAASGPSGPSAATAGVAAATAPRLSGGPLERDRFFVLKSLTLEDLELSVRTNIWATQSHNEEVLNAAFQGSDNVYLIFSANKSGEYFGYARMVSAINEDPAAAIEFAPSVQPTAEVDLPKAIPTEPTEFAPRGRIIDDSARGTIFWEAERDDKSGSDGGQDDEGSGGSVGGDTASIRSGQEGSVSESKPWGKPFRLEWLSTARLPFYRTRGMRNPWNSNREVKIARDGTELEPSVGRRLIGLFQRDQSPASGMLLPVPQPMGPVGYPIGIPVSLPVGYPPMQ